MGLEELEPAPTKESKRPRNSWGHPVFGAKTRDEAVAATWADYDKYPGRRRMSGPEAARPQ